MRAYEFIAEANPTPHYTLKQLNAMKLELRARQKSFARHEALVALMYTTPAEKQEAAELAQTQLDLEKQRLKLLAQKLEIKSQYKDALADMRNSELERRKKQKNLPKFGRRKKLLSDRPD